MGVKTISFVLCATFVTFVRAAQISEADLLGLSKQEIDNDSERLFEYVKTTSEGIRLGCKGKVRKGDTGKVQALFIEDQTGRREFRKLGPVKARVKNGEGLEEEVEKYVPLRDFPMYCLERVFTSSTCPPGPAGRQGREGRNGTIGLPGGPGLPGRNGVPGRDGNPGVQGPVGPRGAPGSRGDTGDTGPSGTPGPQGPEGPRGTDGTDGIPGLPGLVGEPGLAGIPGTPGTPGIDGIDGPAGLGGPDGLAGLPGPDGLPGIPGLAGNNGFSGVTGLDGQNGLPGLEGVPGKCCSGNGGWSPDDPEGCPADLGLSADDEAEDDHLPEEESLKTEPKPLSVAKPSSFWGNDMFSSMNPNSFLVKNNQNKNKHKKGQNVDDEVQVEIQKAAVSKAAEQVEKA